MAITVSIAMSIVFILSIERQRSGDAPLVARTQQRLVRLLVTHLSLKIYGNTQRLFAYNIQ